ncbi:MAG: tRNA (N(6)-L-threonylcarbamoyladenosine(37)-C(2))-methylthiotransferase MtaB [candidate division Zixibacteria bacterium]|nr:tRNA (N(6)-L-threonylcarbamoyladenosine(37)-C(2))-methylthiotransferase MtaB [candidate division Zixibacteria bacterium]
MKTVAFETVGCRLNQYETEKIAAQLTASGLKRVDSNDDADLYIINTCTVTGRAGATCRNIISRTARRDTPAVLVVIGCYVDLEPEMIARMDGVDLVIPNPDKDRVLVILRERYPYLFDGAPMIPTPTGIDEFHQHNRAWIKISDGCNQRCAYCIIPAVRGPLTNRPVDEIINEINMLVAHGYHEVVLTGVHIGKYTYDDIHSPAALVQAILEKTTLPRVRLSSIEPQEVDDDLIAVMKAGGKRVCRHLHIPLQSGSDRILRRMRRPYDRQRYFDLVRRARERIEYLVVGADIIVGFPGETDADFADSVAAAESGLLDYLHVFSYSDRPGTDASSFPNKVRPDDIKNRNKILRDISKKQYARALRQAVGSTVGVISEHRADDSNQYWGITDNYLKVLLPSGSGGGREILTMQVTGAETSYLVGKLI